MWNSKWIRYLWHSRNKAQDLTETTKTQVKSKRVPLLYMPEKFADDNELVTHTETLHSEKIQAKNLITRQVYPCFYCHLRFRSQKIRENHFEILNSKEPPRKRTYKTKPKVNQNIICTYCGEISADNYESRMHELRVDVEDYLIACTFSGCTKRFATPIIMRKHRRIHAEKIFICDVSLTDFLCLSVLSSVLCYVLIHRCVVRLSLVQSTCKSTNMSIKKKSPWNVQYFRKLSYTRCKFCNKRYFCSLSRKYH